MNFRVEVTLPRGDEAIIRDSISEADQVFEEKLKEVRKLGGWVALYHSKDTSNPISELECPMLEEEDPEEFILSEADLPKHSHSHNLP